MNCITVSVLVVIYLASLAQGMDCPIESRDFPQSIQSCPRPFLDSNDKIYCCLDLQSRRTSCCDSFEWLVQSAKNTVGVATSAGYTTKIHQTSNVLFYLYLVYFFIGKL